MFNKIKSGISKIRARAKAAISSATNTMTERAHVALNGTRAEAYSAVEASLTGHTVVSTVHASAADAAHTRIALLCQKRFSIDFRTSLMQAGQAFPIVVFTHKLENNERKIMDISECEVLPSGERLYHTLFRFNITRNEIVKGKYITEGWFEQPEIMSDSLKRKLMQFGVPQDLLSKFLTEGAEYR